MATHREPPCCGDPVLDPLVDGLLDVGEQRLLLRPQQLLGRAALWGITHMMFDLSA